MNQAILEEARTALNAGPVSLAALHERLAGAGSAWSEFQHCLFFLAFDGFAVDRSGDQVMVRSEERSPKDRLLSDIVEVVESFSGKPVPAKEVRKRLPVNWTTTDEQIKAIAKISEDLEVFGPGLIRKR